MRLTDGVSIRPVSTTAAGFDRQNPVSAESRDDLFDGRVREQTTPGGFAPCIGGFNTTLQIGSLRSDIDSHPTPISTGEIAAEKVLHGQVFDVRLTNCTAPDGTVAIHTPHFTRLAVPDFPCPGSRLDSRQSRKKLESAMSLWRKTVTHSMLPGVEQQPDLLSRLALEDTRECGAASRAGVVLLDLSVFHCVGADQSQRVVRLDRRRLPVKVRAWCAGLNPKFHVGTPAPSTVVHSRGSRHLSFTQ